MRAGPSLSLLILLYIIDMYNKIDRQEHALTFILWGSVLKYVIDKVMTSLY